MSELRKEYHDKVNSEEGKQIYSTRFSNIEPVFGHIEEHRKFRRFHVWGLEKAQAQWHFVCFVHNIYKIIHYSKRYKVIYNPNSRENAALFSVFAS